MRKCLLMLALVSLAGCVSMSRHAYLLADTKEESISGACGQHRFQNDIELKKSKLRVYAQTFTEWHGFGVIVPFAFYKSDGITLYFENFNKLDERSFLEKATLIVGDKEIHPSLIEERGPGVFETRFAVSTLKEVNDFALLLPPPIESSENRIKFKKDNGWYFIPILVPHSSKCSVANEI